jgi:hypothetical protein
MNELIKQIEIALALYKRHVRVMESRENRMAVKWNKENPEHTILELYMI